MVVVVVVVAAAADGDAVDEVVAAGEDSRQDLVVDVGHGLESLRHLPVEI